VIFKYNPNYECGKTVMHYFKRVINSWSNVVNRTTVSLSVSNKCLCELCAAFWSKPYLTLFVSLRMSLKNLK
jgi:hypothetical protein